MKRGSDGEEIPGGRALGKYVAQAMTIVWKRHWLPMKEKLERQRAAMVEVSGRTAGMYPCSTCGELLSSARQLACKARCGRIGCAECWAVGGPRKFCDYCSECCVAKGCTQRVQIKLGLSSDSCPSRKCGGCDSAICFDHRRYCPDCGVPLCSHGACTEQHVCRGRHKRNKAE